MGTYALVTAPTAEPITLAEARDQCRITHVLHDAMLAQYVLQGREWAQGVTRRVFATSTWDYCLDAFPREIELPLAPVQSITSVKYLDTSGVEQTLAGTVYESNLKALIARIRPATGQSWPTTKDTFNAVTVRFIAGYAAQHPDMHNVRGALRLYVEAQYHADTYERNMKAAEALLEPLRIVHV